MTKTKPIIAWLGAGLMGTPMASRLLDAGYSLRAWNRTQSKLVTLGDQGALISATPAEATKDADTIFTMLSDGEVTAALLSELNLAGKTVLQMATIGPGESMQLAEMAELSGGAYLEAPVLGSIPEAKDGRLIIMAGGPEAVFDKVLPLLQCLGPQPRRVGDIGQASAMKLALNQLIASLTVAFSTSLAFAEEYGVDIDAFMEILRESALYAPTFDKKLTKMLERHYQNPNFPTEHLIKDIDLFRREAKGVDDLLLEALSQLYRRAQTGHKREDYSCVYDAVRKHC